VVVNRAIPELNLFSFKC